MLVRVLVRLWLGVLATSIPGVASADTPPAAAPAAPSKAAPAPPSAPAAPGAAAQVPAAPPAVAIAPPVALSYPGDDEPAEDPARRRRRFALTIGGVGVALVAIGAGYGLSARGAWRTAVDACDGRPERCPMAAVPFASAERDLAQRNARRSSWLFGIGGAAVVAGVLLHLTAPRSDPPGHALRVVPTVDDGAVGLTVSGVLR